mmetsp:Transcript_21211/g.36160  ORF Transcript_21211/g.36160 Transcript_21211/m.36160 type:complete len:181 (+) Transcript_21211:28-570(+)
MFVFALLAIVAIASADEIQDMLLNLVEVTGEANPFGAAPRCTVAQLQKLSPLSVALGQCTQKAGGNLQQICKCYAIFVAVAKKIDCAAAQTAVDGIDNACNAIHCTGCGGKTSLPDCSQAQMQQVGTASIALSTCVMKNPQDCTCYQNFLGATQGDQACLQGAAARNGVQSACSALNCKC